MATKVFYRCIESRTDGWIAGKEYECGASSGMVTSEFGYPLHYREVDEMCSYNSTLNAAYFERIEREDSTTFEAHGHTWTRHTPVEPMPCDGDAVINWLTDDELKVAPKDLGVSARSCELCWRLIIGWRFADSAKPEQADRPITGIIKRVCAEYSEDESERNDRIAAMDDGHLTPGQKAYIQAKEDAQAAKQQLAKDAQDKALQERADQLADAGKAMDRVNQDHGHKLGWNHG